jgi:hypothetical protein
MGVKLSKYVVTVWRKDGKVYAETFMNLISAKTAYIRAVQPDNPDSLNIYVTISKVMEEHHQTASQRKR